MLSSPAVEIISECFIQPKYTPKEECRKPLQLSHWDLQLLTVHYNQKGLLFAKPPSFNTDENQMKDFLEKLKDSLSIALVHFYPLAGRLATLPQETPPTCSVYVDCANGPGAKFIRASLNLTVKDILSLIHVPKIVYSFFDHVGAINYDGHNLPLMTIQVTELIDGIFIGPSINHSLVDGTSFWHFINSWSEIFNAKKIQGMMDQPTFSTVLSRPPIHKRWIPEEYGPILSLPFSHPDEFIFRYHDEFPELKEKVFYISSDSLQKLKAKAKAECGTATISTFQALGAHVWRCITRARNLPPDETTRFCFSVDNRSRISPPLSPDYFGNSIQVLATTVTCGELMNNGLGWAARKLNELVINQTDKSAREWAESWAKVPTFGNLAKLGVGNIVQVGSSPRFNVYGSDFGLGKALAVRSGFGNKFDGKIMLFPAREGGGNIEMEVCLLPSFMTCFESDDELLQIVSEPSPMS
ncbi:OLC1v1016812C1 [Oldenlandia corymbosa var. corymbosa]|uniref:OLC1v1016812C1 n=1 Tax=Oldenlandia corymbosa var. corymbosa TaxID=529605 RepID=A0AAV1E827_OLDCO|nr:OLC1v1016812C1 [Oldenlandia corymbosa var. corymbosa]